MVAFDYCKCFPIRERVDEHVAVLVMKLRIKATEWEMAATSLKINTFVASNNRGTCNGSERQDTWQVRIVHSCCNGGLRDSRWLPLIIILFLREVSLSCSITSVGKGDLLERWDIYSGGLRIRMRIYA